MLALFLVRFEGFARRTARICIPVMPTAVAADDTDPCISNRYDKHAEHVAVNSTSIEH